MRVLCFGKSGEERAEIVRVWGKNGESMLVKGMRHLWMVTEGEGDRREDGGMK